MIKIAALTPLFVNAARSGNTSSTGLPASLLCGEQVVPIAPAAAVTLGGHRRSPGSAPW